ncbi:MAG TPA: hypothetical protein VF577_02575 [Allosphingosinicella sp.]|jgi:chromate transport protein ChrA
MRPASIVKFERVVLLTILFGLASVVLNWDAASAPFRRLGYGENFFIGAYAASIVIMLVLLWLIARRASAVAKWIYVALYSISIVMALFAFSDNLRLPPATLILQLVQWALILFSIWLLFRPDSNAWFAGGARNDSDASV